jgi:ABC-2 type transport system permease protein
MLTLLIAGLAGFLLAAIALGDKFARASLDAIGSPHHGRNQRTARSFHFGSSPAHALRRKEWRLLLRDPSLFAQLGLQIVYTIPLAVVLVRSQVLPLALALTPAIVVIAAQVAASLAWIAVSGEDAPELIASAPVSPRSADLAKLSAIAIPVATVAGLPVAGLALASPAAAVIAFAFSAGAGASTALLNLWHPMPASRRGMLRRHAQSKLIGLLEHLLAILWAVAAVLALLGSLLWVAPVILVVGVLSRSCCMKSAGGHPDRHAPAIAKPQPGAIA